MSVQQDFLNVGGRLVSINEAVELGFGSRPTIYRRIHDGEYDATKINGRLMLIGNSLLSAAERNKVQPRDVA